MEYEEQYVLPLLPPALAARIQREHHTIRAYKLRHGDWPNEMLMEHAAWEDEVFGRFAERGILPRGIAAKMESDHGRIDAKIEHFLRTGVPPVWD